MPSAINAVPATREVRLSLLHASKYNPRKIDPQALAALAESMDAFGIVEPIVWNERSGNVVGGHQRLRVLRSRKVPTTTVVVVDLDPVAERALNVALNNPHIGGEFDVYRLGALIDQIEAERGDLYDALRLGDLRALAEPEPATRERAEVVAPLPAQAVTRRGDLWTLGRHRILCGDATDPRTFAKVLAGRRVDALVTDPPYGVDLAAKNARSGNRAGRHSPIAGDAGLDYRPWFGSWLALVPWAPAARFAIFMSGTELHHLRLAIDDVGLRFGQYLIWRKQQMVLGRKDYHSALEHILTGTGPAGPQPGRPLIGPPLSTVLAFDRPRSSEDHPTMKPTGLVRTLLTALAPENGVVLDPFLGSGTTLIAAEEGQRIAYGVELDPRYVDVAVRRFEAHTGQTAVRNA